jgi:osmotically-inducible protein OsmY
MTRVGVATTFSGSVISQSAPYPTPMAVQQALVEKMGDKAKELSVTVDQGTVNLSGWVHGFREVHQARYLASKLPGVERAYSSGVRTWVTTDPTPVF